MQIKIKKNQFIKLIGKHNFATGISFDSRTIKKNEIFFAMPGKNTNGALFIKKVLPKAAFVITEENPENNLSFKNKKIIKVKNVIETLKKMAQMKKENFKGKIVAITGSVGKTTCKEAIFQTFKNLGIACHKTEKNNNGFLGMYTTFALLNKEKWICIEIGMDDFNEIYKFSKFVNPDYSIITTIGPAHIEKLGSLKNIVLEKSSIIQNTKIKTFFNESWYSENLIKKCRESKIEHEMFEGKGTESIKQAVKIFFKEIGYKINSNKINLNIEGRRKIHQVKYNNFNINIIDSVYNASLTSMIETINFTKTNFQNSKMTAKIAIIGSMTGIGEKRDRKYHEFLASYLKEFDKVILIGQETLHTKNKLQNALHFETAFEALSKIHEIVNQDSAIMIKGSSKMNLKIILNELLK